MVESREAFEIVLSTLANYGSPNNPQAAFTAGTQILPGAIKHLRLLPLTNAISNDWIRPWIALSRPHLPLKKQCYRVSLLVLPSITKCRLKRLRCFA